MTTWLIEIENIMYQYSQWKGNAFFPLTQENGFLIAFAKRINNNTLGVVDEGKVKM